MLSDLNYAILLAFLWHLVSADYFWKSTCSLRSACFLEDFASILSGEHGLMNFRCLSWMTSDHQKVFGQEIDEKMSEKMMDDRMKVYKWILILLESFCECQGIPHFNLLWSKPAWHHSHLKVVTFQLIPKYENCSVYRPVLLNWLGGPKMDAFIGSCFLWWQKIDSEACLRSYLHRFTKMKFFLGMFFLMLLTSVLI